MLAEGARRRGLTGVPTVVIGRAGGQERAPVSGTRPVEVLERAVRRFA